MVRLGRRPRVSMIMVVRLECWVRFLVAGRVRLLLPLDLRLTLGLRRANLRHLDFCGSIHPSKDATLVYDSQGSIQKGASLSSTTRCSVGSNAWEWVHRLFLALSGWCYTGSWM